MSEWNDAIRAAALILYEGAMHGGEDTQAIVDCRSAILTLLRPEPATTPTPRCPHRDGLNTEADHERG